MNVLINVVAFVAVVLVCTKAEVCFPGICDKLPTREPLQCKGSVVKNGGFCGCFDTCAKQEGETCETRSIRGRPSPGVCDTGLTCTPQDDMIIGMGTCVKAKENNSSNKSSRQTHTRTLCEQRRIAAMISMVVYRGQWFPKCDAEGLFMPEQCDNIGQCFCVDVHTGVIDETSKVVGSASC